MITPQTFFYGSESCSGCIQGSLAVVGYPNFHTRAMSVQDSHGVDEHLALKERLAGLNIARVVGFHQLFFVHHFLQKAFERNVFRKIRFHKWSESGFTKSKGFF